MFSPRRLSTTHCLQVWGKAEMGRAGVGMGGSGCKGGRTEGCPDGVKEASAFDGSSEVQPLLPALMFPFLPPRVLPTALHIVPVQPEA